jgi:hypothetical protein
MGFDKVIFDKTSDSQKVKLANASSIPCASNELQNCVND